jgi:hypothetical protein
MAFKMKAGSEGPMKKNFGKKVGPVKPKSIVSAKKKPVDLDRRKVITFSDQVNDAKFSKANKASSAAKQTKPKYVSVFGGKGQVDVSTDAGKKLLQEIKSIPTVSSSDPGRVTKIINKVKKAAKVTGKLGGKMFMGGIIDPFSDKEPTIVRRVQKAQRQPLDTKKTY